MRSGDQLYFSQYLVRLPDSCQCVPPTAVTYLHPGAGRGHGKAGLHPGLKDQVFFWRGLQAWLGQLHPPHLSADPPLPYQGPQTGNEYLVLHCPPGLPEAHLQLLPLLSIQGGLRKRKYTKKGQGGVGAGNGQEED